MDGISHELIQRLPKAHLHCHLDGSIQLKTLIELSNEMGLQLPAQTVEGLSATVFKARFRDLDDYLQCFAYTCAVMKTEKGLERVAYEFACDQFDVGVLYFEVRYSPDILAGEALTVEKAVEIVAHGMDRAVLEYNKGIQDYNEPEYRYGIILCAMRYFDETYSQYFSNVIREHEGPLTSVYAKASLYLAKLACRLKSLGIPVVGLDLAGSELNHAAKHHTEAFRYAKSHGLHRTVHAGEAYGSESIQQALDYLDAERIGHGLHLFDAGASLAQQLIDSNVCVEVCISSNLQTDPLLDSNPANHPLGRMLDMGVPVCINADNCLISRTDASKELSIACSTFKLTRTQLYELVLRGFKASFMENKDEYVAKVDRCLRAILFERNKEPDCN